MQSICIYGTVYNNVNTVEKCIESIWRPEYDVVIVDNYSTDGTWEKLLELKKEYNLKIYRYRCTRGLGRYISLYKCPEKSITAWFDLDTIYLPVFHRAIEYNLGGDLVVYAGPLIARRELILSKGGWRDLNYGEDWEIVSRVGFDVHLPVVLGFNQVVLHTHREKRYGGVKRLMRTYVDIVRGEAFSVRNLLSVKSKKYALAYIPAKLLGFYRNRNPDNHTWVELASLVKAIPPREAGISDEFFHMCFTLKYICNFLEDCENTLDTVASNLVPGIYKFNTRIHENVVHYYKNPQYIDGSMLQFVTHITLLK
jgi:glycosyltransferase involved in cell wall biosynthesis